MIDFHAEIQTFKPISLHVKNTGSFHFSDKFLSSVTFYNKAIERISENNISHAIIGLNKAVQLNPNFYEAIRLLGICYAVRKKVHKAVKAFNKLAETELYRDQAKAYLDSITITHASMEPPVEVKELPVGAEDTLQDESLAELFNDLGKFHSRRIRSKHSLARVLLLCTVVASLVVIPVFTYVAYANKRSAQNKTYAVILDEASKPDVLDETADSRMLQKKLSDMEQAITALQSELASSKAELDRYKGSFNNLTALNEIEKLFVAGNSEEAADSLILLKSANLDEFAQPNFDRLWRTAKTSAFKSVYNRANRLYNEAKYQDALPLLQKVQQYEPDTKLMPYIHYQTAKSYMKINDDVNALSEYQLLKETYPNSTYAKYCDKAISEIKKRNGW